MVFYSSTNFRIIKPWAIISNFIRFDLGFWETWKPFYRKLKYREKVLEEFQSLHRLPRRMFLYSWSNFNILKLWAMISNFIRFNLDFCQASKPFYWKLKYREKVFEEFQHLPCFPRKMVLHSSTNFHILNPWPFDRFQNDFIGNWNIGRTFLKSLRIWLAFREKWFCIGLPIFAFESLELLLLTLSDSIYGIDNLENHFIGNSHVGRFLKRFNFCLAFPEKWFFIGQPIFAFERLYPSFQTWSDSI